MRTAPLSRCHPQTWRRVIDGGVNLWGAPLLGGLRARTDPPTTWSMASVQRVHSFLAQGATAPQPVTCLLVLALIRGV
jgi:hypothetical protein